VKYALEVFGALEEFLPAKTAEAASDRN